MIKGRFEKLGRFDACLVNSIIELLPSYIDKKLYRENFFEEFNNYSDKGRKRGEPENEGCVRELENIEEIDIENPVHLAKWLKEHLQTKYQKRNARNERDSFLRNFN